MEEFRALVEECRVVLVTLDHEELPAPSGEVDAEVFRDSSDEESWIEARSLEHPGQKARRKGFSVGACHNHRVALANEIVCKGLGHGSQG